MDDTRNEDDDDMDSTRNDDMDDTTNEDNTLACQIFHQQHIKDKMKKIFRILF
jgi:hypothetical protein